MNMRYSRHSTVYKITWLLVLIVLCLPQLAQAQSVGDVMSISWSPDGTRIVGGGTNGLLRVWNTSGQTLLTLSAFTGNVYSVDWSPDSTKIVSGHEDGKARIWNATTGQLLATLTGHTDSVTAVDWSPDGSRIVSGSFNDSDNLRIWNSATYQVISVRDSGTIFDVNWSPDSTKVMAGFETGYLGIYDQTLGDPTNPAAINGANLTTRWSPNGSQIASGDFNGQIHIWNASTYVTISTLSGHTDRVDAIAYTPNGENLASASHDGTIRIWYVPTGETVKTYSKPTNLTTSIAWSPDGRRLAYGGTNGTVNTITVFQGGTGLRGEYFDVNTLTGRKFFRIDPTIDFNWAAGSPNSAIAVDTFSVRWVGKVESLYSQTYTFYSTHNDGTRLWVNGQQLVNDWVNRTSAVEQSGTITLVAGQKYDIVLEYYENTGNASIKLEWSSPSQTRQVIPASQLYPPEGQLAFRGAAGGNEEVYIINPNGTGEINVSGNTAADNNPVWSPDGSKMAFVSTRDGNEEIYTANADGTGLRRLTNHASADNQPAWSPDGTKIAFISQRTGSGNIYIITVEGTTGIPTPTLRVSSTYTEGNVMWSPNGLWLTYDAYVNATYGTEVFLVSSTSGNPIRLTTRGGIDAAPFWSPDGTKVAFRAPFGGGDQIWVALTASPYTLTRLTSLGNNHFQSWSPDGTKILFQSSRDGNNEVYVMNADGSAQTRLTNSPANESYSVWSADARQIAFIRSGEIWLMHRDGANQRNFTNTPSRTESQIVWWQTKQSS